MITPKRELVIDNIKNAIEFGDLNLKVEVDDPQLTVVEKQKLVYNYLNYRKTLKYKICSFFDGVMINLATRYLNFTTVIEGTEKIKDINGSAIITSNHFNPVDNTIIRTLSRNMKRKNLYIVSQETNLAMPGIIGFLMKYSNLIPISSNIKYMGMEFPKLLEERINKNEWVLVYPEQEMWFNYRKPRTLKRGAYYYAAKYNIPVISCFVEIRDLDKMATEKFHKVKYILHILDPIFPDKNKSIKENSENMCKIDYAQKKFAYEKAYGKKLEYNFETCDIAGWEYKNN